MEIVILIIYASAMLFIFLYSIVQIQLVYHYLKNKKRDEKIVDPPEMEHFPFVTFQLPIYNEKYVIERLIESISVMDYPKDKFEIQVLDDSDDETSEIVSNLIKEKARLGLNIQHIQRSIRKGFKAGALAEGMTTAKGELIAIFDADFIPQRDFLLNTIKHFEDKKLGMVQAKWEHVNKNYSFLTQLQAFGLDAHFTVEQSGRNRGGHFINFNGTAGIWRKSCIVDAGGWQSDTLTEDLDLSYRAQLKGWKFKYLESCGAPAELPAHMNALKTQQYRWTKGAAECTRKNLMSVLKSNNFPLNTKLNAIFHLLNSSLFICIVVTSILSIPVLYIKHYFPEYSLLYKLAGVFLIGVIFLSIFYFVAFASVEKKSKRMVPEFLIKFPLFLSVSMGLSLHNGIAAFEGLIGRTTPFVRTPKFNIQDKNDSWHDNKYVTPKIGKLTYIEILLTCYFAYGLYLSIKLDDYGLFPFILMLLLGYSYVAYLSIRHSMN